MVDRFRVVYTIKLYIFLLIVCELKVFISYKNFLFILFQGSRREMLIKIYDYFLIINIYGSNCSIIRIMRVSLRHSYGV